MMLKKAALLVLPLIGVPLALQATADPAAQTRAPWSIRINSGGPAFTDPAGRSWLADQYFTGGTSASTTKSISGTSDQTMYQDERYGLSGYRVPVPGPGIYVLTLHLTDTYATDPGQRVFSVSAEGQPVVPDLDLVSTIGPDAAYDVTVPVRTEDDYLDLQFSATANSALINGLEISSGPVAPSRSATTLTSTQRPLSAVAGSPVSCTGRLTRRGSGTPVADVPVTVTLRPDLGASRSVRLTTNGAGAWGFVCTSNYNTVVTARFDGNTDNAPSDAPASRVPVSTRLALRPTALTSRASGPLVLRGTTFPSKPGRTLVLSSVVSGRLVPVARTAVDKTGAWRFSLQLRRGDYRLQVGLGATSGNLAGSSPAIVVHRR
jgi:hypothetical protein